MRRLFRLAASTAVVAAGMFVGSARAEIAGEGVYPPCEANQDYKAVDMSIPSHGIQVGKEGTGLKALSEMGITTIFRYYDYPYPDESLTCKTLLPDEAKAILSAGFNIGVIFQHNNDDPHTFIKGNRGTEDAKRALELAKANGQPYGSKIFFGVDGADQWLKEAVYEFSRINSDGKPVTSERKKKLLETKKPDDVAKHIRIYEKFLTYYKDKDAFGDRRVGSLKPEDMLPFIVKYFKQAQAVFDEASGGDPKKAYVIGAYGSGTVCEELAKLGVTQCWLSQSMGHPGSRTFRDSNKWGLRQMLWTTCPWPHPLEKNKSVSFDFNVIGKDSDYGQWNTQREDTPPIPKNVRPAVCQPFMLRERNRTGATP
jgi:hypothetical protein